MITQIRSFLVVVEEGGLHRAAERLHMSQSALSRQMQTLESEVGGRLLDRTSTGVQPTNAGHALVARMRRLLTDYDSSLAEVRRVVRGQSDQLRIGYIASAAQEFLKPALPSLRKIHPAVKVKLLDLSPNEQITALRRGAIDLGLTGQESGRILSRDFYTRKLAALPSLAVLTEDHPLATRRQVGLSELKNERFVGFSDSRSLGQNRWLTKLCRKCGRFRPTLLQNVEGLSEAMDLVVNEEAVALIPAYMRDCPAAGVSMIPVADPEATWDLFVVWQRGPTTGPMHTLIDALTSVVHSACNRGVK